MSTSKFKRLITLGILSPEQLQKVAEESERTGQHAEDLLLRMGVPKHELLFCLAADCNCPFVEYDENLMVSSKVMRKVHPERLKKALWLPISVYDNHAEVIACDPMDETTIEDIRTSLGVENIEFQVALPADLVRIIENNQDLNAGFPKSAGRTPLAKVRTFLAEHRVKLSLQRTAFARGRTGLSFLRTGLSLMGASLTLYRIFGLGYLTILEAPIFVIGLVAVADGMKWYMAIRGKASENLQYFMGEPKGVTFLKLSNPGDKPVFSRTDPLEGADAMRSGWNMLSPVERRRFLANDRTDLAEERTAIASLRTDMARARTGLAFARTGVAFAGFGSGLYRHFPPGPWAIFDISIIIIGTLMALEGLRWYLPGRGAAIKGLQSVIRGHQARNIWELAFPSFHKPKPLEQSSLAVKSSYAPGIWGTTGLALERTVLAERRNIMARLRTVMARARTAMAFIRTGLSISAVGTGLLVFFGTSDPWWTLLNIVLIVGGAILIIDGVLWYSPAEKMRQQFPYCFGDFEISLPDYGKPSGLWRKAVFSHDDIE